MTVQITRRACAALLALTAVTALAACSSSPSSSASASSATGGTYTLWDPYPQYNASSAWWKLVASCGTKAGVTIKHTAYDTTALTTQALVGGG
jgi:multiple sugar transport system substrate-binding protein